MKPTVTHPARGRAWRGHGQGASRWADPTKAPTERRRCENCSAEAKEVNARYRRLSA